MKEPEFVQDALSIYVAYVDRKMKKVPDYRPNPIVRALICALEGAHKQAPKRGEKVVGISQDGADGKVFDAYAVVLELEDKRWNVVSIKDLQTGSEMPSDLIIAFLNMQIHMDRIPGDSITAEAMVGIVNKCFVSPKFVWITYRVLSAVRSIADKSLLNEASFRVHPLECSPCVVGALWVF